MEFTPRFQKTQARTESPSFKLIFFLLVLLSLQVSACKEGGSQVYQESKGLPGEIMLVMSDEQWDGAAGDSLRSVLMAPFPMILQLEPMFHVIHKTPSDFTAVDRALRNVIMVEISPDTETRAKQVADRWSKPQMVYSLHAKNTEEFLQLWGTYAGPITKDIRLKDRERIAQQIVDVENYVVRDHLRETMDLELTLHRDFREVKLSKNASSFIKERIQYLSGKPHDVTQGIVVYTYPYDNDSILSPEHLNAKRDTVLGKLIQSANDAPMIIEKRLPPTYTRVAHDSLYAIEGRGLWRMNDPVQGGTFVSLTVVDEKKGRVVTVDGYVFSPQFDKRPLLLEIEAFIYSLKL